MSRKTRVAATAAALLWLACAVSSHAGTIVVVNDEWPPSDSGFPNAAGTGICVSNRVAAQLAALQDYADGGGSVYILVGTGNGGAVAEADAWNPFLSPFGLASAERQAAVPVSRGENSPHHSCEYTCGQRLNSVIDGGERRHW